MSKYFLGIDTSNYKTSIAIVSDNGDLAFQRSELLSVKPGERGLRQSDAFFMHANRLPDYIQEAFNVVPPEDICAIACSDKPRSVEGSYMPCFLAGLNYAKAISSSLQIPLYCFSHQDGHAAAVIETNKDSSRYDSCLLFHLSGGTTEFLVCEKTHFSYSMEIVGGTKDISFGQLIDRVGVACDMPFPAGSYLDKKYDSSKEYERLFPAIKLDKAYFNLSGAETKLLRYIEAGDSLDITAISNDIFNNIASIIIKAAEQLCHEYSIKDVILVGGVASSSALRKIIDIYNMRNNDIRISFGDSSLSGDNAVGIAMLCRRSFLK